MTEPVVVTPMMMRSVGDCGICCTAMLCGVSYAEIISALPRRLSVRSAIEEGITVTQAINVGRKLGCVLVFHDKPDDDEDEIGVLYLTREDGGHVAMYLKGVVYNPATGELWTDIDAFLQRTGYAVEGFLWRKS